MLRATDLPRCGGGKAGGQVNVVAVCRGAPGLGRVAPSVGLCQTLARTHGAETMFLSYGAGYRFLAATGRRAEDLGAPDGLFVDAVSSQAIRILDIVDAVKPGLVLVDGEFFVVATLAHLAVPVVYIANPHDLLGDENTFRRVNKLMLSHADAVIISSLRCSRPRLLRLRPTARCLVVPALIREFEVPDHPDQHRILISLGGGSVGAAPGFRLATDSALAAVLTAAGQVVENGNASGVTVVLGADGRMPAGDRPSWLAVKEDPVDLTSLFGTHDVLVTRAGRNTIAEALYCGIPTVLLPVTADPHRGCEQESNASIAAYASDRVIAVADWQKADSIAGALAWALSVPRRPPSPRRRGNEAAVRFVADIVDTKRRALVHQAQLAGRAWP